MYCMLIQVFDICDECVNTDAVIEVHVLTGETKCLRCETEGKLDHTELVELLRNLED